MTTVPLALLVFRGGCPVTQAYLEYMSLHGMQPELIMAIDYVGETQRSQDLRRVLGLRASARLLRTWRNRSARVPVELANILQKKFSIKLTPGCEPDYENAAPNVLYLTVNSYADPRLLMAMRDCGLNTFLYCSGGRVPASLFQAGFSILHVHPGVVPHIRGSDGLLWSLLVRGCPGVSCFYMDAGIDTGRLIDTIEYPTPNWPGLDIEPAILYHAMLQCYDPHLRASLLATVLKERLSINNNINELDAKSQMDVESGHYYAMHPELRLRVLSKLCAPG